VGPVITGRALTLPIIAHFVRNGSNAMPAWRPTEINDAELALLAEWLQASAPPPPPAPPPSATKPHGGQP
jgi:mono/diheme cytochrome c family protein